MTSGEKSAKTRQANALKLVNQWNRARLAYQVWAHRAGLRMAFEDLTQHQMDGWRGVVKALEQHPRCWKCGAELICLRCKEEEKADPCWERP